MEIWHLFVVANGETEIDQSGLHLTSRGIAQLRFAGTTIESVLGNTQANKKYTCVLSSEETRNMDALKPLTETIEEIDQITVTDQWPSTIDPISITVYNIRIFVLTKNTLFRTKVLIVVLPPRWATELKKMLLNEFPEAGHPLYTREMRAGDMFEMVYTNEAVTTANYHISPA